MRIAAAFLLALVLGYGLQLGAFNSLMWLNRHHLPLAFSFLSQAWIPYLVVLLPALLAGRVGGRGSAWAVFIATFGATIAFEIHLLPSLASFEAGPAALSGMLARAIGLAGPAAWLSFAGRGGGVPGQRNWLAAMLACIMLGLVQRHVCAWLDSQNLLAAYAMVEGLTRPLLPAVAAGIIAGRWWPAVLAGFAGYAIEFHLYYRQWPALELDMNSVSLLGWFTGAALVAGCAALAAQKWRVRRTPG